MCCRPRPRGSRRCAASLLDHFRAHGYRLVQPPLVEHLDSLLTGTGRDLDLQTFKVVDPLSGRMLGVRADTTPQVARIDAHLLNEPGVTRLCYAGSVLRTRAGGPARRRAKSSRSAPSSSASRHRRRPRSARLAAVRRSRAAGVARPAPRPRPRRRLSRARRAAPASQATARTPSSSPRCARRTCPAVAELTAKLPGAWRDALTALPALYGPAQEVLARGAREAARHAGDRATRWRRSPRSRASAEPHVEALHIDLADLHGYHYQNGAIFSVFTAGEPSAIGNGGRYDGIGKAFGRARPATGFTLDLRQLASVVLRESA